ncbi:hypothetical protein L1887_21847 [Cichorium endivia]|nr:hypothetical protein L1887_21847 [Cichorium endivia]
MDDVAPRNDTTDVIQDVMEELMEKDTNVDKGNSDTMSGACYKERDLEREFQSQTQPSSGPVEIFGKALGTRHGYIKGSGRKPPSTALYCFNEGQSSQAPALTHTQDKLAKMLADPTYRDMLAQMILNYSAEHGGGNNKGFGNEGEDDDTK